MYTLKDDKNVQNMLPILLTSSLPFLITILHALKKSKNVALFNIL